MTTSEEKKCYLFAIMVNGKIIAAPARNWWATDYEMRLQAAAYCTAARAFRKTAGVMVYEQKQNLWEAVHGCNLRGAIFRLVGYGRMRLNAYRNTPDPLGLFGN